MTVLQRIPIRTSDRNNFRKCRVAWNFGSPLRMNMQRANPGIETRNFDFGSAVHEAMEIFYDGEKQPSNEEQREFLITEAMAAYRTYMQKWAEVLIKGDKFHPDAKAEWSSLLDLGNDMLTRYFEWARDEDEDYEIAYSEVEFEVPIEIPALPMHDPISDSLRSNTRVAAFTGRHLLSMDPSLVELGLVKDKRYLVVLDNDYKIIGIIVLQGRLDLIVRSKSTGRYKVIDHKTAKLFYDDTEWLDLDPQASTYYLAAKVLLGIDVDEVIFNQLRKKKPEPPRVLKRGYLSQDKSQNTTIALYKAEIKRIGHSEQQYAEFLDNFEDPVLFRRIPTSRSVDELAAIQRDIIFEAVDMLNDPRIYPNPSMFNCNGCFFREPCRLRQSDSIEYSEWFLTESGAYVESTGY